MINHFDLDCKMWRKWTCCYRLTNHMFRYLLCHLKIHNYHTVNKWNTCQPLVCRIHTMHVHLLCEPNENASSCVDVCICMFTCARCSRFVCISLNGAPLIWLLLRRYTADEPMCDLVCCFHFNSVHMRLCICSQSVDNVRSARANVQNKHKTSFI